MPDGPKSGLSVDANGGFRGTGGGAYAGGYIGNLDMPLATGYAVGATDTGNENGTAALAIEAQGKQATSRMPTQ
jgi:hypothetical protein